MQRATSSLLIILGASCLSLLSRPGGEAEERSFQASFAHNAESDCEEGFHQLGGAGQDEFVLSFQDSDVKILRLSLAGQGDLNQFITKYTLEASFDGLRYFPVNGGQTYAGNSDRRTKVTTYFFGGLPLKFLKFRPLECFGAASFILSIAYQPLAVKDVMPGAASDVVVGRDGRAYSRVTLFERIGGVKVIHRAANHALAALFRAERFAGKLKVTKLNKLVQNLLEFLQVLLGGPTIFEDHPCATELKRFGIDESSFDFFAEILSESLAKISGCGNDLLALIRRQLYLNKAAIVNP